MLQGEKYMFLLEEKKVDANKHFFYRSKKGLGGGFIYVPFSPLPGEMIQYN